MEYIKRIMRLIIGLLLFAFGSVLSIRANIGLAPWDAFSMGFANLTNISYGNIVVISGIIIIAVDIFLKEKIGFGTILNALLIGKVVDIILYVNVIPKMTSFALGIIMLLIGQVILCIGSYYYIGAALGCGPRDALMVAIGKRLPKVPIGFIRGSMESFVLIIGWFFGAKVGIGTVIAVFGIGFILQYTFSLFHFDVKGVQHESVADTVKNLSKARS